jgi:uroporphyrinogen-III synthase
MLSVQMPSSSHILFPQAVDGREEFLQAMTDVGESVTVVPAYRMVPAKVDVALWKARMTTEDWQALVATSPKGLRTWLDLFGHAWCHEQMAERQLFVMGATTAETAKHLGFRNVHVAPHATLESLAQAITSSLQVVQEVGL